MRKMSKVLMSLGLGLSLAACTGSATAAVTATINSLTPAEGDRYPTSGANPTTVEVMVNYTVRNTGFTAERIYAKVEAGSVGEPYVTENHDDFSLNPNLTVTLYVKDEYSIVGENKVHGAIFSGIYEVNATLLTEDVNLYEVYSTDI